MAGVCAHFARVEFMLLPTLRDLLTNTVGILDRSTESD